MVSTKSWKEKKELRIFLSYFAPHKKLFILDMVCALMIAMIDLAFPFISRWCMYTLLPQNAWNTFWAVMGIVFVFYILRSVFTYIIWYWGHNFGILVETDIRRDLFRHIQKLGFDYCFNHYVFNPVEIGVGYCRYDSGLFGYRLEPAQSNAGCVTEGETNNRFHQCGF